MTLDFEAAHGRESAGTQPVKPAEPAPRAISVDLRWYSIAEAAELLGISQTAVRKHVASGSLSGVRVGRSWRVLLAGNPDPGPVREGPTDVPEVISDEVNAVAQTSESLMAMVRDLQGQNLALAAHVGLLQGQLQSAQEQLKQLRQLEQPDASSPPVEHEAPAVTASPNAQELHDEIHELRHTLRLYEHELQQRQASEAPRKRGLWPFRRS